MIPRLNARVVGRSLVALAFALPLVGALSFAACHTGGPRGPTTQEKLLSDLSLMAVGRPLAESELHGSIADFANTRMTIEKYVDNLLEQPMGGRLAKDLVLGASTGTKDRHPMPVHSILKSFKDGDRKIHYLKKKCAAKDAVSVRAWWDADVLICPDSYRPEVLGDGKGNYCGSTMLAPRDVDMCGCGPALAYCTRDKEHHAAVQNDLQLELVETTGLIVDGDRPIEDLFTMNETIRNDTAETLYRRASLQQGKDAKEILPVRGFGDGKGKLQKRDELVPGQHAGILTTPAFTYVSDALRGVMRNYFDYLWCTGLQSSGVTTESILSLDTVDLRVGDGWKKLAAMNVCTDCHARLDYGMQFFHGYPSSTQGVDFRPTDSLPGNGPLYSRNIKDDIGEAPLVPSGFAKLVTEAPEFGDCMTRRVVDHVFNGTDDPADFAAVRETFTSTHRMKKMMRTAMLRYANRATRTPDNTTRSPASTGGKASDPGDSLVAIAPALRTLLDEHCKECHKKDSAFDYSGAQLSRRTLDLMIDKVGFKDMPKNQEGLDDATRRAFVAELAQHLYTPGVERETAIDFFGTGMRGVAVHRFNSSMLSVSLRGHPGLSADEARRVRVQRPAAIESSITQSQMSYTPGVAINAGVTAIKACKEGVPNASPETLAACVEAATSPHNVVAGPLTP